MKNRSMFGWTEEILASQDSTKGIIVLIVFGGVLIHRAIKLHQRIRKIEDTPRSKSSSAAQGLTELEGFAWPDEKTFVTTQQKESVYYEFQLQKEETTGSGDNRRTEWVTVASQAMKDPFYICDATGLVKIDPARAEMELIQSQTKNWKSLSKKEKDFVVEQLVGSGVPGFPPAEGLFGLFSSKFRIIEKFIPLGSPLYVTGDFRTETDVVEAQVKGLTRFRQMVYDENSKNLKNQKALLDKNKDGKISHFELVEGYTFAAEHALRKSHIESTEEKSFPVYGVMRNSEAHQLFIAGSHEKTITERLKHRPFAYLLGGAACLTLAISLAFPKIPWKAPLHQFEASSHSAKAQPVDAKNEINQNILNAWHSACVGNALEACQKLLNQRSEIQLSPENVRYYRSKACSLGDSSNCQ